MCRLVKRLLCLALIGAVAFVAVALWKGGEPFRRLGSTTGGALQKSADELGERADTIKGRRDETERKVKTLTDKGKKLVGDDEPPAQHGTPKQDAKKKTVPEAERQPKESILRSWWRRIVETIAGPEKDTRG